MVAFGSPSGEEYEMLCEEISENVVRGDLKEGKLSEQAIMKASKSAPGKWNWRERFLKREPGTAELVPWCADVTSKARRVMDHFGDAIPSFMRWYLLSSASPLVPP